MKSIDLNRAILTLLQEFGHATESLTPSTQLQDDLGIDSLETAELSAAICRRLGVSSQRFPDTRSVRTIADLAARIEPLLGSLPPEAQETP